MKMLFRGKRTELAHGVTVEPGKVYEVEPELLSSGYVSATISDGDKSAPCWYSNVGKMLDNWVEQPSMTVHDAVTDPEHYAGDGEVDCMRAMHSMVAGYGYGEHVMADYWCITAFKYLWRWPRKNGVQDLKKARRCIEYAIAEVEHEG